MAIGNPQLLPQPSNDLIHNQRTATIERWGKATQVFAAYLQALDTAVRALIAQVNFWLAVPAAIVSYSATGVNFNSANTDTPIAISLPAGFTRYMVQQVVISGASASLTTATFGLFTAAAGGGVALLTGTAITVSTGADATNNNAQLSAPGVASTESFLVANAPTLFFRVQTAQGSAATGNVTLILRLVP